MDQYQPHSQELGRCMVIGMSDGLIVPFSLATGMYAAGVGAVQIGMAGIVAAAAGGILMGIGGYFSEKDEPKHHGSDEAELEKSKEMYNSIGLHESIQRQAMEAIEKDHQTLASLIEPVPGTETTQPVKNGLIIMLCYFAAGFTSMLPYFLMQARTAFVSSVLITFILLIAVGFIKGKITGTSSSTAIARFLITGVLASAATYLVAGLFR